MSKVTTQIPSRMKWLFWSYDIESLDLKDDKDYIITQILNHGTWQDLKWLYKLYSEKDIKAVVKKPMRGVWFEKILNFWTTIFEIKLPKKIWDKAIMNIYPPSLAKSSLKGF